MAAACMLCLPAGWAGAEEAYRLRSGDTLNVTVVGHPDLSQQGIPVRPDGRIALPLAQEVKVQGKTVHEAIESLCTAYLPYLSKPQVSVSIARFRPIRVTVMGQVEHPGALEFEESPTLAQAIAMAGGLSERAMRNGIRVMAPDGTLRTFDLDRVLTAQEAPPPLVEGTVIEVAEVWGPDLYRVTIPVLTALITAAAYLVH